MRASRDDSLPRMRTFDACRAARQRKCLGNRCTNPLHIRRLESHGAQVSLALVSIVWGSATLDIRPKFCW